LMMRTTWWKRLDKNDLMMRTIWWWRRLDDENDLMMITIWWWEWHDDENDLLMMKMIYLSTLNRVDKEFFLIFLYIASLEQTWQNSSNINLKIELKALINSIRSNINSRIEFELLFEIQFYDQIMLDMKNQTKSRFETHDYFYFVHQFFDHHFNFCFWIHQFDDFDDVLNNNLCFKKFINISLFFAFLRNRSKFDKIDIKFNNVFVKKNFEKDLLSKRDKNDDFD
jgi:hypothetical protein